MRKIEMANSYQGSEQGVETIKVMRGLQTALQGVKPISIQLKEEVQALRVNMEQQSEKPTLMASNTVIQLLLLLSAVNMLGMVFLVLR